MGKSRSKLPKVGAAAPVGDDERVRKSGDADLQNGWLSRHGTLALTDDRLVFSPTVLDRAMLAKRREIVLDEVSEIERFPKHVDTGWAGRRARVLVHTEPCIYELMVPDIDAWIDAMEKVYELRAKAGRRHKPTITREGYENLLLAEE
ncbi:MAG: hypothetical protein OEM67_06380 [Thermoleophilia bacterium]|nr:hypothetical protein [Thermoleophilia bacterium]MDH3724973.1 hypothetical protein [Thermoleophilia bacterium]